MRSIVVKVHSDEWDDVGKVYEVRDIILTEDSTAALLVHMDGFKRTVPVQYLEIMSDL